VQADGLGVGGVSEGPVSGGGGHLPLRFCGMAGWLGDLRLIYRVGLHNIISVTLLMEGLCDLLYVFTLMEVSLYCLLTLLLYYKGCAFSP